MIAGLTPVDWCLVPFAVLMFGVGYFAGHVYYTFV